MKRTWSKLFISGTGFDHITHCYRGKSSSPNGVRNIMQINYTFKPFVRIHKASKF